MTFKKIIKKIEIPDESEWRKSLQKYIKTDLVPRFLPINQTMSAKQKANIEKMRFIMTSNAAMEIWAPAFTHPSFDSITDKNFEVFEYLGDRMLSYALGVYMKKKYPDSNQDNLNNFDTFFTSRKPLAEISAKTKLLDYVRTIKSLNTDKEKSDIFESVVGAITRIGDDLISPGVGFMISYNYITSIYNWYDSLELKTGETSTVNKVMQGYYDALGWREIGQSKDIFENWDPETQTMSLYLNETAIKMLTRMGRAPQKTFIYQGQKRTILATAVGSNKKEATDRLYNRALKNLQTIYKISQQETKYINIKIFFDNQANKKNISTKDSEKYYNTIRQKMRKDGYVSLKIRNYDTKYGDMYVLYGTFPNDKFEAISRATISTENIEKSRLFLYKTYIESGKMKNKYSYYKF